MVVSLYVCEIPNNVTKEDLDNLFSEIEGYIETRTKVANDKRTIAFIDYQTEKDAKCARETLQGFKFTDKDKGLIIKISDNTKGGQTQSFHAKNSNSNRKYLHSKRHRDTSTSNSRDERKLSDSSQQGNSVPPSSIDNTKNPIPEFVAGASQNAPLSNLNFPNQQNFLKILEQNNTLPNIKPAAPLIPGQNLDNNSTAANQTLVSNLQTLQLLCQLGKINPQTNPNKEPGSSNEKTGSRLDELYKFDDDFSAYEYFNQNATKIVYVEGIPYGATEREIAHIFRPFPGFQNIRIIPKEKNGKKTIICFVDFENVIQSTLCIQTLQGYRFDKNDLVGLHFSYGISKNNKK